MGLGVMDIIYKLLQLALGYFIFYERSSSISDYVRLSVCCFVCLSVHGYFFYTLQKFISLPPSLIIISHLKITHPQPSYQVHIKLGEGNERDLMNDKFQNKHLDYFFRNEICKNLRFLIGLYSKPFSLQFPNEDSVTLYQLDHGYRS